MHDDDTMTVEGDEAEARPLAARLVGGGGAALALVLLLWAAAHVMIPPVHPSRPAPTGHYGAPCWACHFVTESAPAGADE